MQKEDTHLDTQLEQVTELHLIGYSSALSGTCYALVVSATVRTREHGNYGQTLAEVSHTVTHRASNTDGNAKTACQWTPRRNTQLSTGDSFSKAESCSGHFLNEHIINVHVGACKKQYFAPYRDLGHVCPS